MSERSDAELERLLARRIGSEIAGARSIASARERVWIRLGPRLRTRRSTSIPVRMRTAALAFAAVVALFVGLGWLQQYRIDVAQGGLPVLYREEVARTSLRNELFDAEIVIQLRHVEGGPGLRAGALIDVRLNESALPATIEVRSRPKGTTVVEVIGRTAQLQEARQATAVTRTSFFAPLPPLARGETRLYEVWLFVESARGIFESDRMILEITGKPEGDRARIASP